MLNTSVLYRNVVFGMCGMRAFVNRCGFPVLSCSYNIPLWIGKFEWYRLSSCLKHSSFDNNWYVHPCGCLCFACSNAVCVYFSVLNRCNMPFFLWLKLRGVSCSSVSNTFLLEWDSSNRASVFALYWCVVHCFINCQSHINVERFGILFMDMGEFLCNSHQGNLWRMLGSAHGSVWLKLNCPPFAKLVSIAAFALRSMTVT